LRRIFQRLAKSRDLHATNARASRRERTHGTRYSDSNSKRANAWNRGGWRVTTQQHDDRSRRVSIYFKHDCSRVQTRNRARVCTRVAEVSAYLVPPPPRPYLVLRPRRVTQTRHVHAATDGNSDLDSGAPNERVSHT
jgi:hypothetical protein